uniref:Tyrosinase_Cu-bd domain-containing protein n=1 Tax=Meloidogyne hapla TaxID=6305 RepID=A0A1I8AYS7_MELHA
MLISITGQLIILLIILIYLNSTYSFNQISTVNQPKSKTFCEQAPNNGTRNICMHMKMAIRNALEIQNNGFLDEKWLAYVSMMAYRVRNLGPVVLGPLRKKSISTIHRDAFIAGGAHGGPSFCVFHRELIKRLAIMLRKINPNTALHYWDSTLDSPLPNPADSILFTEEFFGTTNSAGYVATGPFKSWQTLEGNPGISRDVGKDGGCMNAYDVYYTLSQTKVEKIMAYTQPNVGCPYNVDWESLEYPHGKSHNFIGGDLSDPATAANDPFFFCLHSFVDMIFENWRQKHQNRTQRENDYPPDLSACEVSIHYKNSIMTQLGPLINGDGLRNAYTDYMYEYEPSPTCNATRECGSNVYQRSVSVEIAMASLMAREDVCWNGDCVNGVCVKQKITLTTASSSTRTIRNVQTITVSKKSIKSANTSTSKSITTTSLPTSTLTTDIKTTPKPMTTSTLKGKINAKITKKLLTTNTSAPTTTTQPTTTSATTSITAPTTYDPTTTTPPSTTSASTSTTPPTITYTATTKFATSTTTLTTSNELYTHALTNTAAKTTIPTSTLSYTEPEASITIAQDATVEKSIKDNIKSFTTPESLSTSTPLNDVPEKFGKSEKMAAEEMSFTSQIEYTTKLVKDKQSAPTTTEQIIIVESTTCTTTKKSKTPKKAKKTKKPKIKVTK